MNALGGAAAAAASESQNTDNVDSTQTSSYSAHVCVWASLLSLSDLTYGYPP